MHVNQNCGRADQASTLKQVLGQWFSFIYTTVYAAFIVANLTSPKLMSADIGSLNVAVVFGFVLISFALILALAYNHICTHAEELLAAGGREGVANDI
jgi:uncharacterized membrane protein (DUF485 family)